MRFRDLLAQRQSNSRSARFRREKRHKQIRRVHDSRALVANHHFDDVRLPKIPHVLQKLALVFGAPLGRLLGFGPTFDPIPGELAPAAA